jgi:hypothetical protein
MVDDSAKLLTEIAKISTINLAITPPAKALPVDFGAARLAHYTRKAIEYLDAHGEV